MTMSAHTTRRADIDLIRGFAMTTIVLTHVACITLPYGQSGPLGLFIGSAALFFMTSGALCLPVEGAPSAFYRRRIPTLSICFVLWSVLYAWLNIGEPQSRLSFAEQLKWLVVTPTWGPGWFVYALIGIYLAMPVISPWLRQATPRQLNVLVAAWLVSGLLPFAGLHTEFNQNITILAPFTGFLGYAVAGYWLAYHRPKAWMLWALVAAGVLFGIKFYITGLRYGWEKTLTDDLSVNVMCANIGWFAFIMAWHNVPKWLLAPFAFVSRYSLGIYLSHWLLIRYIFKLSDADYPYWLLYFVAVMVLSSAIGYALHKLIALIKAR